MFLLIERVGGRHGVLKPAVWPSESVCFERAALFSIWGLLSMNRPTHGHSSE